MLRMMEELAKQLVNPRGFFNSLQNEGWKPAFVFFLWVTLLISLVTPILNYFGMESVFVLPSTNLGVQPREEELG